MLRSKIPRESDLAPPNAAGKQAKGKPSLAVYKRKVGGKVQSALGWDAGNFGCPLINPLGILGRGIGTLLLSVNIPGWPWPPPPKRES